MFDCPECHISSDTLPVYSKAQEDKAKELEATSYEGWLTKEGWDDKPWYKRWFKDDMILHLNYRCERTYAQWNHKLTCPICGYTYKFWKRR